MKKYLKSDPLPWLTDGKNPAVTYLTHKEFSPAADPDLLYNTLIYSPLTAYFRKNSSGNVMGDSKNFDLFYNGSVWFFLLAAESGYDNRTDFIKATANYICGKSQLPDGGFSFNWHPPVSVGCRTGDMIKGMIKAKINDERTDAGLSWIIKNQRNDGGWLHCPFRGAPDVMKLIFIKKPGNGHLDDPDVRIPSCPVATCSCMSALVESKNNNYSEAITRAAVFLSSLDLSGKSGKCRTRCGLSIDPVKPGYPVMSQFDQISVLQLLTAAGLSDSGRGGELFNHIMQFQGSEGRWQSLNSNQGMIPEKKGESRWVTLNALRMIKAVTDKENQLEKA
jgi:hypothetical protein